MNGYHGGHLRLQTRLGTYPFSLVGDLDHMKPLHFPKYNPILAPPIIARILADYNSIPDDNATPSTRTIVPKVINREYPWVYFDGSTQDAGCGGGMIYYTSLTLTSIKFKWFWEGVPIIM